MPLYINTKGRSTLNVAICQRCQTKVAADTMIMDPNIPDFWTCGAPGCLDDYDPMRLPPPPPDNIVPPFSRPDTPLVTPPDEQLPIEPPPQYD